MYPSVCYRMFCSSLKRSCTFTPGISSLPASTRTISLSSSSLLPCLYSVNDSSRPASETTSSRKPSMTPVSGRWHPISVNSLYNNLSTLPRKRWLLTCFFLPPPSLPGLCSDLTLSVPGTSWTSMGNISARCGWSVREPWDWHCRALLVGGLWLVRWFWIVVWFYILRALKMVEHLTQTFSIWQLILNNLMHIPDCLCKKTSVIQRTA